MQKRWQGIAEQVKRTMTAKGRAASGCFSCEGTRLLERALRTNWLPTAVLVAQTIWDNPDPRGAALLETLADKKIPCCPLPNDALAGLTEGRDLGGFIALLPLPEAIHLPTWLAGMANPTLLVAVDVVDPGNLGGMIRTAHALGADLFVNVGSSDPFHPRAVRTSMGSLFKLPIVTANREELLATLGSVPIETVGTVAAGGEPLPQFLAGRGGTAVFLGNEYWGLPEDLLRQLDRHITIPMAAGIDSFSVNAAAAIVLYELQRQKGEQ